MTTFQGPPLEFAPDVGARTLGGFLLEVADRFGPREALVFDDPVVGPRTVRWTYTDLRDEAFRVAAALISAGIEPAARVGILMGNRPEAVAAFFGAALAGATAVLMSTFSTPSELEYLIDHSGTQVLLTQSRLLGRELPEEIRSLDTPTLERIASVGDGWDDFLDSGRSFDAGLVRDRAASVRPADPGSIVYSSGTTDRPKGVLHSNGAPSLQFWIQAKVFGRHPGTRMWTALPMFWTAGLNTGMGATLASGGCWIMQETFHPAEAISLIERERVTEPYTLPHQTAAMVELPEWETADLSSLTCVYGKSAFARHPSVNGDPTWNSPVGYGLSETSSIFATHYSDDPRELLKQSTGRLLPGNRLRVIDPESGRLLGPGESGELAVAGPTLMDHYVGKTPQESLDVDGFFHTGDAGWMDDAGFLHWTGRRSEMIKTGGANVSPAEIEVALRAFRPAKLSRVLGRPDQRLGEVVVLCMVLQDGAHATAEDVRSFLRERLASYKVPKEILFLSDGEVPMTSSDTKVRDDELRRVIDARESIWERCELTTTEQDSEQGTGQGAEADGLDTSDLDNYIGVPMEPGELKEPVVVNDIRRWVQGMHYPNPLHYDEDWATASRFGRIVAPQSFTVTCDTSHGASPAQVGLIPNSHLIFGGDEWWFFGPRVEPGDHLVCHRMPFDYKVTDTKFAGPTCFQRGDTLYVNQRGERVALQRSTAIRYQVRQARKKKLFHEPDEPEWTDDQLLEIEDIKGSFIAQIQDLGHGKRLFASVEEGEELALNALGPHSLASFTTEWRAYPMTTWGATLKGPTTVRAEALGYTKEMAGFEGDRRMERVNPELTDGAYYGPSRGHLQPRWAKHVGMARGYGYGASMGAWILDYVAAWAGEWGFIRHSNSQYRNPAFTGDVTYIRGRVTGKRVERKRRHIVTVAVELTNQHEAVMAKGTAEVELPPE